MGEQIFKTELEALIACRNHWQFMEITNDTQKSSYEPSELWDNKCAVCHFAGINDYGNRNCRKCPLRGCAWKYNCEKCEDGFDSFYQRWRYTKYKNNEPWISKRRFWANRMVYACNQAIENLLLNKKG